MMRRGWLSLLLVALWAAPAALAQEAPPDPQDLLDRLHELEREVERLRGAQAAPPEERAPDAEEPPQEEFRFDPSYTPPQEEFRFDPDAAAKAKEARGGSWADSTAPGWLSLELPWSTKLTVTGSIRARGEYRAPASYRIPGTFGRPATDDRGDGTDFALLRTRVELTLDVVEHLQAHVEIQDSRVWGDQVVGADVAELQLRQGYIAYDQAFGQPLTIWIGRWAVPNLGDQRLIGVAEFNNVGRSWDGVLLEWRPTRCLKLTAFAANVREGLVFSTTGDENDDFWFSGLYLSWSPIAAHTFEAYLFWRDLSDRVFSTERSATRLGEREDYTFGGRAAGERCGWDYSGELMVQWGNQAGDSIRAFAGVARLGFTQPLSDQRELGAHVEYAYASGDSNPTDGRLQTFDPLVPARFRHHGVMNLVAFSNIHDVELGVRAVPCENLTLHVEAHGFWLDKRKDAWFDPGRSVVRRDPSGASRRFLGSEVDAYATYEMLERLSFLAGYAHFFPGQYVRDSSQAGAGIAVHDQGWLFAQVELRF
ncbi:MAG: alginate export family protein [Planctomycetes bacterium]|nr:alginate export family protein [Planctomycetota bacterium]